LSAIGVYGVVTGTDIVFDPVWLFVSLTCSVTLYVVTVPEIPTAGYVWLAEENGATPVPQLAGQVTPSPKLQV
jgi:hypothetical protein